MDALAVRAVFFAGKIISSAICFPATYQRTPLPDSSPIHVSVMLDEVIEQLQPREGQTIVDGTLGGGGHTRALAERVGSSGEVIALDRDPRAIAAAERNLAGLPVKLVTANFRELP